jgi:glutaminase
MTACMVDTESLSVMAATLANGGICPTTGKRLIMTANDCLYGGHESLSVMAATLANDGICPTTGEKVNNDCL